MAHKWKGLGLALRLHPDTLSRIEADCRGSGVAWKLSGKNVVGVAEEKI